MPLDYAGAPGRSALQCPCLELRRPGPVLEHESQTLNAVTRGVYVAHRATRFQGGCGGGVSGESVVEAAHHCASRCAPCTSQVALGSPRARHVRPQRDRKATVGLEEFVLARAGCPRADRTLCRRRTRTAPTTPAPDPSDPDRGRPGEAPTARLILDGAVVHRGALRDSRYFCRTQAIRKRQRAGDRHDLLLRDRFTQ